MPSQPYWLFYLNLIANDYIYADDKYVKKYKKISVQILKLISGK